MKTMLLILILFMALDALQAQQVMVKDSGLVSFNGGPYAEVNGDGIYTHTKNSFCKDSSVQAVYSRRLYVYDSVQRVYQILYQNRTSATDTFTNSTRFNYTYIPSGKYKTVIYETKISGTGTLIYTQKYTYDYDANDNLTRQSFFSWNPNSSSWIYNGEFDYFNGNTGNPDSAYRFAGTSPVDTSVIYYSYYPAGKLYQRTTYEYVSGVQELKQIETSYHDSVNYIKNDSTVTRGKAYGSDSFSVISIASYTNSYNADGTLASSSQYLFSGYYSPASSSRYLFYYFYAPCSSALPVSFLSFSARKQNHDAVLNWQMASEINTTSFIIQRSMDGIHFTTIGNMNASGDGSRAYTFTDINALQVSFAPKLYYRIAKRDKDGSLQYSSIVSLDIAAGKMLITASPNPATNVIKVYSPTTLNDANITVSDLRGRMVYSAKQTVTAGSPVPVNISALAKGIYIITVQASSYKQQIKIVKE